MRKILYIFLTFLILGIFIVLFAYINQNKLIDRFVERQSKGVAFRYELLDNRNDILLVTVGTGSALPSDRVQSCNAVIANGRFFIFDIGAGGTSKIEDLLLPLDRLDGIFISHWHSDHFIDLPNLVNRSWQLGRKHLLPVYGPDPIDSVLIGVNGMLKQENIFREKHHGSDIMNASVADGTPVRIESNQNEAVEVYNDGSLVISAFEVDHDPVQPSLGFIIDFNDKKLVLGGDTRKNQNLIRHSRDADILVHDAMQKDFMERASRLQQELGNERNSFVASHIQSYHASPEDAAEVAQAAGVRKLILSHLAPAPENPISRRFFTLGLDKIYTGPIILAEDGDVFYIK